MTDRAADRRVAPADATWLMMDEPTNPMMITGILWFGEPVDRSRLLDTLQRRLVDRYPKFASRIVHHGGVPYWEPDPNFDLLAHVHRAALPAPAGRPQMEEFVAQMMSTRLDPDRALWFIHVVENFERGTALVVRIHHVIADGISLARVLLQLAGDEEPAPEHDARSFGDTFRRAYALGTSWLMSTDRWREVARAGAGSAAAIARLLTLSPDPPTPLKQPLGTRKVAAWLPPLSLDRVKAVGKALGGTVNDVLLTALALAMADYLRSKGHVPPEVRSFIPVNLRPLDRPIPRELGNQFGLVLLGLPLDQTDPRACLAAVKQRMDAVKAGPEAALFLTALQVMSSTPDPVERAVIDHFGDRTTLITTNVPGPREPLYIAGSRVAGVLVWVPQSASVGLGVSILSYAGDVRVGVAGDARCLPDPHALTEGWRVAFERLEQAVTGAA